MFRHIAAALAVVSLAAPAGAVDAAADPVARAYEDVRAHAGAALWEAEAAVSELALASNGAATALAGDDPLVEASAEFARAAAAASALLRRDAGPADLACIFAGMAEDAEARIAEVSAAPTTLQRARAVAGLQALFDDAVELTPAANADGAGPSGSAPAFSCPGVAPDVAVAPQEYLTVQP